MCRSSFTDLCALEAMNPAPRIFHLKYMYMHACFTTNDVDYFFHAMTYCTCIDVMYMQWRIVLALTSWNCNDVFFLQWRHILVTQVNQWFLLRNTSQNLLVYLGYCIRYWLTVQHTTNEKILFLIKVLHDSWLLSLCDSTLTKSRGNLKRN